MSTKRDRENIDIHIYLVIMKYFHIFFAKYEITSKVDKRTA